MKYPDFSDWQMVYGSVEHLSDLVLKGLMLKICHQEF